MIDTDPEYVALLAGIAARPGDHTAMRVLADWLRERERFDLADAWQFVGERRLYPERRRDYDSYRWLSTIGGTSGGVWLKERLYNELLRADPFYSEEMARFPPGELQAILALERRCAAWYADPAHLITPFAAIAAVVAAYQRIGPHWRQYL